LKQYIGFITFLFFISPAYCSAQEIDFSDSDSISVWDRIFLSTYAGSIDSIAGIVHIDSIAGENKLIVKEEKFKPNPTRATLFSAIFPGLGQVYNRKFWKLPLVYGSFIGCIYAINWNGNQYNGYRRAYTDFVDENPDTNSWDDYRYGVYQREDPEKWTSSMVTSFATSLKSARDFHRRNRDLSYIVTVGVYAIWIIDAYVDAQLFDFDISPDLSMRIEPVLFDRSPINSRTIGMQLCFRF